MPHSVWPKLKIDDFSLQTVGVRCMHRREQRLRVVVRQQQQHRHGVNSVSVLLLSNQRLNTGGSTKNVSKRRLTSHLKQRLASTVALSRDHCCVLYTNGLWALASSIRIRSSLDIIISCKQKVIRKSLQSDAGLLQWPLCVLQQTQLERIIYVFSADIRRLVILTRVPSTPQPFTSVSGQSWIQTVSEFQGVA